MVWGSEGTVRVATLPDVDFVVSAIVGVAGLEATYAAVQAGKTIGLANKEAMVAAGEILTAAAREKNVALLPIDSEHNAIHQCMRAGKRERGTANLAHRFGRPVPHAARVENSETSRLNRRSIIRRG